jgi:hypothetical protein
MLVGLSERASELIRFTARAAGVAMGGLIHAARIY